MKTYIKPEMKEKQVGAQTLMAGSISFSNSSATDNSGNSDLSNGRRGNWGNLWCGDEE